MTDTESGFKWWMRYVVVPVLGGGGIIAIVIAFLSRPAPPKPEGPPIPHQSATQSQSATNMDSHNPTENKGSRTSLQATVPSSAESVKPPAKTTIAAEDQKPNAPNLLERSARLEVYDNDKQTLLAGGHLRLPNGESFTLKWRVKPEVVHGSLVIVEHIQATHHLHTESVGYEGSKRYDCDKTDETSYFLEDQTSENASTLLDLVSVTCSSPQN